MNINTKRGFLCILIWCIMTSSFVYYSKLMNNISIDSAVIYNDKLKKYESFSISKNNWYSVDLHSRRKEVILKNTKNSMVVKEKKVIAVKMKRKVKKIEKNTKYIYDLTKQEIKLIEHVVMGEAEGEPLNGKIAIAQVILNRTKIRNMTVKEVVYEKDQFSCVTDGRVKLSPSEECILAVEMALSGEKPLSDVETYFNAGYSRWHERNLVHVRTIGEHRFYKEKGD